MRINISNLKKKTEGFTIIEVLIVLAIAGLILLVVFLAVPALQRSQRNNGRQSEGSRLSTSITSFISNNSGNLPGYVAGAYTSGQGTTDGNAIITDFGTFKYFTGISATADGTATKIVAGKVGVMSGAITVQTAVTADAILIDDVAVCGSPTPSGLTTTAGTARQVALIYTLETAGGNYNQVCIQAQ